MDKALFSDLLDSLKEASAIRAGKKSAVRRTSAPVAHSRRSSADQKRFRGG